MTRSLRRQILSKVMITLACLAAFAVTLPLLFILFHLVKEGASSLQLSFFTQTPAPVGESGGGMANAISGTLILIGLAAIIGIPVGVGAGMYLAENKSTPLASVVRLLSDVLNGLPSIVMGIFVWELLVRPMGGFSAIAGGVALGIMMIPMVTRTTEEMIKLVPNSLTEAALALGYTRWRSSISIVLKTALPGIATGALIAIARISGETAPLLFTAFGNQFWSATLNEPIAALPLQIFTYAISPYEEWHRQAWAGALVLISMIMIISVVSKVAMRSRFNISDK